jgi:hypothetical protein
MSDPYICPLNRRPCGCDPAAVNKKLHPCMSAKHIAQLVRMLASNQPGEVAVYATALSKFLPGTGLSFNDIAIVIENCNGEIEEYKYGDSDAAVIFTKGVEQGKTEAQRNGASRPAADFYDENGMPRWSEMAGFCSQHASRLNAWETEFIDSISARLIDRELTPKMEVHLTKIFIKLGGKRKI